MIEISKKEKNDIIEKILSKFGEIDIISYEYVERFLESIVNGATIYDGMKIKQDSFNNATNEVMEISYIIQNSIYYKLCKLSSDDIDVLLFLVEERRAATTFVLKKMGVCDLGCIEDFLIDAINNFRGDENFSSYITRYVMAKVRGGEFKFKSDTERAEKVVEVLEETKKKKKKKKNKERREIGVIVKEKVVFEEHKEIDGIKEQAGVEDITPYEECLKRCGGVKGTGIADSLVMMAKRVRLISILGCPDNREYEMFLLLRLGFVNSSFYSRNEIKDIIGITISDVIKYERKTWNILRQVVGNCFTGYEEYLVNIGGKRKVFDRG